MVSIGLFYYNTKLFKEFYIKEIMRYSGTLTRLAENGWNWKTAVEGVIYYLEKAFLGLRNVRRY